jgi:tetratricopeptide (TPR) repeat protein
MARCYSQFAWNGAVAPHDFMPKAKAAVVKALALDPQLAQAHREMAQILYQYDWDWARSEREIRRALELNPHDARAHRVFGTLLRTIGRTKDAKAQSQRVHEVDPLFARTPAGLLGAGAGLRSTHEYEQAITEFRKALQLDPALSRGHFQLGLALTEMKRIEEGIDELRTAVRLSQKNLRFHAGLGWALALAGRDAEARQILADLKTRSEREYVSSVAVAMVHIGLKETEPALQFLEQAYEQRDFELVLLRKSAAFQPLKSQPRFRELMRKIGLPEA